jgi:hypothetical protein
MILNIKIKAQWKMKTTTSLNIDDEQDDLEESQDEVTSPPIQGFNAHV